MCRVHCDTLRQFQHVHSSTERHQKLTWTPTYDVNDYKFQEAAAACTSDTQRQLSCNCDWIWNANASNKLFTLYWFILLKWSHQYRTVYWQCWISQEMLWIVSVWRAACKFRILPPFSLSIAVHLSHYTARDAYKANDNKGKSWMCYCTSSLNCSRSSVVTDATNSQESATIPVTIAYKMRYSYGAP